MKPQVCDQSYVSKSQSFFVKAARLKTFIATFKKNNIIADIKESVAGATEANYPLRAASNYLSAESITPHHCLQIYCRSELWRSSSRQSQARGVNERSTRAFFRKQNKWAACTDPLPSSLPWRPAPPVLRCYRCSCNVICLPPPTNRPTQPVQVAYSEQLVWLVKSCFPPEHVKRPCRRQRLWWPLACPRPPPPRVSPNCPKSSTPYHGSANPSESTWGLCLAWVSAPCPSWDRGAPSSLKWAQRSLDKAVGPHTDRFDDWPPADPPCCRESQRTAVMATHVSLDTLSRETEVLKFHVHGKMCFTCTSTRE